MMRIINADKLPWVDRVILVDQVDGDINITIAKEHTSYVNDETPTVEAIPVEWIKETIKIAESVQASKYAEHLRTLLEDWREENDL
jgi:hypothetical protein